MRTSCIPKRLLTLIEFIHIYLQVYTIPFTDIKIAVKRHISK
jgi:hypothetical protein